MAAFINMYFFTLSHVSLSSLLRSDLFFWKLFSG